MFYGLSYVTFMALEFSLFEGVLQYFEQIDLLSRIFGKQEESEEEIDDSTQIKEHSRLLIGLSAFIAGAVGGFLTNPVEYIAVNTQINSKFNVFEHRHKKGFYFDLLFRGSMYRTVYYGF